MDWLSWLIILGAAFACLLAPAFVVGHVITFRPRRLEEIEATFRSPKALRCYGSLFSTDAPSLRAVTDQFRRVHGTLQYLVAVTVFLLAAAGATGLAISPLFKESLPRVLPVAGPLSMALAGALIWAIYETASKIQTRDLIPNDLYAMTVRLVAAVPVGHVADQFTDVQGAAGATAFAVMSLPMRDIRLFFRRRFLRKSEGAAGDSAVRSNEGSLAQTIDGLGDETLARLADHGIVTYLDMAYTDPIRMMARSGYSLHLVLSWMDKALLTVYFGEKRTRLAEMGMPCALDACECYLTYFYDGKAARGYGTEPAVKHLAAKMEMPAALLADSLQRVYEDPYVELIRELWYPEPYVPLREKKGRDALPEQPGKNPRTRRSATRRDEQSRENSSESGDDEPAPSRSPATRV